VIPRRPGDNGDTCCFELCECDRKSFAWWTIANACQIAADSDQDHCATLMPLARLDPRRAV
jgi:hypothetical protein